MKRLRFERPSRPFLVGLCIVVTALGVMLYAENAECDWCVSTFCSNSAQCPGDCVCAIPWGKVNGSCSGTR